MKFPKGIDKNASAIYQIQNVVTGKVYIGSSVQIWKRFKDHRSRLKGNKHGNIYLQNAWNKYGMSNFIFIVLEIINDDMKLVAREQHYLNLFSTSIKYNIRKFATAPNGDELKKLGTYTDLQKPVYQLSASTGEVITKYKSITIASQETNIWEPAISGVCSGLRKTAGGYLWQFKEDYDNGTRKEIPIPHHYKVNQCDLHSGEVITQFNSLRKASEKTGIPRSTISEACKGKRISVGGFVWRFVDEDLIIDQ